MEEPVNFYNRTKQILPSNDSKVQEQLNRLQEFSIEDQLKINKEKSKVMLFNMPNLETSHQK